MTGNANSEPSNQNPRKKKVVWILAGLSILLLVTLVLSSSNTDSKPGKMVGLVEGTATNKHPSAQKEIELIAPVGKFGEPVEVIGHNFQIFYGGPVKIRVKRFDGSIEEMDRDTTGTFPGLGKLRAIEAMSRTGSPITNSVLFL